VLRTVLAPNASPLTLDGTRTYIIGERRPAVIDPGPNDPDHLDALVDALGDGVAAAILVTHYHPDHLAGAGPLAARLDVPVRRLGDGSLDDGSTIDTDAGPVTAIATPGHTRDHAAFHWPDGASNGGAVFCGDLLMGGQDTTLVPAPEGRIGPYLVSLERVRSLRPSVLYPAHGPAFDAPGAALDRYVRHREERLAQVMAAVESGVRDYPELLEAVYGSDLDEGLERPAMTALKAYIEHLHGLGRIRRIGRGWEPTG
jgi:glyoxylase-like metal-dependent hydrolase (beta-lactamase superfamily II)